MKFDQRPSVILSAVIDASPLFTCLVANFNLLSISRGLPGRYVKALKPPFQPESAQRELLKAVGAIRLKLTTSHAIGELQGLQSSRLNLKGSQLSAFWTKSVALLRAWGLDERLIRLLELGADSSFAPIVSRIGPADTGVIRLALENNCALITEDADMRYSEALRLRVDCRLLEHLIPA